MLSPLLVDFLESAALPAILVALGFFIVGGRGDPFRARLQSLFFTAGLMAGSYVLVNRLTFPPRDVNEAFSWVAAALMIFIWISPRPIGQRYLVRALFVVGIGFLTLWQIHDSLHGRVALRNLLAFFFLALGVWSIVEKSAQKVKPLTLVALPLISATALSLLLLFKGSASLAQLVSIVCALLGGVLAVALVTPNRVSLAAVMPFVSVFLVAIMACGHFYLDINPWWMIYLCIPFLLLWIRGWIPFVPHSPIGEAVMLGCIALIPMGYFLWNVYKTSGPLY